MSNTKQTTALQFRTSLGDIVTGKRLTDALYEVGEAFKGYAYGTYDSDPYASHVTELDKMQYLIDGVLNGERIKTGATLHNFTIAQRVNTILTGECIALLPK